MVTTSDAIPVVRTDRKSCEMIDEIGRPTLEAWDDLLHARIRLVRKAERAENAVVIAFSWAREMLGQMTRAGTDSELANPAPTARAATDFTFHPSPLSRTVLSTTTVY